MVNGESIASFAVCFGVGFFSIRSVQRIIGFAEALGIIPGMLKADSFDPVMLIPVAICLGLFGLGLWMFIDGVRKKVRVKK